jgi:hypothetical protein
MAKHGSLDPLGHSAYVKRLKFDVDRKWLGQNTRFHADKNPVRQEKKKKKKET